MSEAPLVALFDYVGPDNYWAFLRARLASAEGCADFGVCERYAARGRALHARGEWARALAEFTKSVVAWPRTWRGWQNAALCLVRLARWRRARLCATRALQLNPTALKAWHASGVATRALGHLQASLRYFKAAQHYLNFMQYHATADNLDVDIGVPRSTKSLEGAEGVATAENTRILDGGSAPVMTNGDTTDAVPATTEGRDSALAVTPCGAIPTLAPAHLDCADLLGDVEGLGGPWPPAECTSAHGSELADLARLVWADGCDDEDVPPCVPDDEEDGIDGIDVDDTPFGVAPTSVRPVWVADIVKGAASGDTPAKAVLRDAPEKVPKSATPGGVPRDATAAGPPPNSTPTTVGGTPALDSEEALYLRLQQQVRCSPASKYIINKQLSNALRLEIESEILVTEARLARLAWPALRAQLRVLLARLGPRAGAQRALLGRAVAALARARAPARARVPSALVCPITLALMRDPATTPQGHSYERVALLRHVALNGCVDPLSRQPFPKGAITPNHNLKAICSWYTSLYPWAYE